MKKTVLILILFLTGVTEGQETFIILENGLAPKSINTEIKNLDKEKLFNNTIQWIEARKSDYNLTVENSLPNEMVQFTSFKGNAVTLGKQYFNLRYTVTVKFNDGNYIFTPTKIELKVNSKYDMGWKDFNLNTGAMFYKRGKVIRKYKKYLQDLTSALNELHSKLNGDLKGS